MSTDRTYQHLAALRDALPDLDDAMVPGTPRRWAEHDLTPDQRTRQDARAIAERHDKTVNLAAGIKALGDGQAPLRLDILDTRTHITAAVAELEDAVCDTLGLTPLAGADTTQRISRLVGLLDRIAHHPDLADHVHTEAARLHHRATRALGDSEIVRRLNARCHLCDARSLRAFPERELVVCVNATCRCPDETCGCHNDPPRRHRWPFTTWPWLAQILAEDIGVAS